MLHPERHAKIKHPIFILWRKIGAFELYFTIPDSF